MREGKKNIPSLPIIETSTADLAGIRSSIKRLLLASSREKPLFLSAMSQDLLGNQSPVSQVLMGQLVEEVKQGLLSEGHTVGVRPCMNSQAQAESGVYVIPNRFSRARSPRVSRPAASVETPAQSEADQAILTPSEIKILVYRLFCLKDWLDAPKIAIDTSNPLIKESIRDIQSLTDLSPQQIAQEFVSAVNKIHQIISTPEAGYPYQQQPEICQWLINACLIIDSYCRKTSRDDFWSQLTTFSPVDWNNFLKSVYGEESPYLDYSLENHSKPTTEQLTVAPRTVNPNQEEGCSASPDSQTAVSVSQLPDYEARTEEEIRSFDKEIDSHLARIIDQLGVRNLTKHIIFSVNQLTRPYGINPERIKMWEEESKLIRRTGTKSDGRHPIFDLVEAIWIGYINGNFLKGGISSKIAPDFRWYIERYLSELQEAVEASA